MKYILKVLFNLLKDFLLIFVSPVLTPHKDIKLKREIFNGPFKKISICTTCMNRTVHLKQTYLSNLIDNIDYPAIEFILINYGSRDDMENWVKKNLSEYIQKGNVKYFHTSEPETFHMSKAKNLAHRLATGEIIVNLDADNYLGKFFAHYVNYCFNTKEKINCQFTGRDFRYFDTSGRIALTREDFYRSGGYNEELPPFGAEDIDLLKRLEVMGNTTIVVNLVNFLRTIKHNNKLRLKNLGNHSSIEEMRRKSNSLTEMYVNEKKYQVNVNGFTQYKVTENFTGKSYII